MTSLVDHPLRYPLSNELHARPFPTLKAPAQAVYLALKAVSGAAGRDHDADRAHLIALLDRFGAPHPQPGATHYSGQLGKHRLKWESHTEFVTFMLFLEGATDQPFHSDQFAVFPDDWLAQATGARITSILVNIEISDDDVEIAEKSKSWFVSESLAISRVLEDTMVIAGDFRIDPAGHTRFAMFARSATGQQRTGRVLQRLCEIETYKAMSMLGLQRARNLGESMGRIDGELTTLLGEMRDPDKEPDQVLEHLLDVSAELEDISAQVAFRFGATKAYEKIVNQRIDVLREELFNGRQSFGEFMMRRFDPAMRTVESTHDRLQKMSARAQRASDLLRTRVDVERSAQNQAVLTSMDKRADLQLRLQRTVEGFSVVAISYYAVNLVLYLIGPLQYALGISKAWLAAGVTPIVLIGVWLVIKRIRESIE